MRILTVDDNPIIRMGLRACLEGAEGVISVADTDDPERAVGLVATGEVDVVLLDIRMPQVSGLDLLPRLSGATVVMLTHTEDQAAVAEALAAGAAGYVVHGSLEPAAIVEAIRLCAAGGTVTAGVPTTTALSSSGVRGLLTPREAEVMDLVAEGLSNGEVAAHLGVTEKTVKNHLNRLFAKLGATTRSQAIVRWLREGVPAMPGPRDPDRPAVTRDRGPWARR